MRLEKPIDRIVNVGKIKLKLTNLEKIYFPNESYTKEDVLNYYNEISQFILPYLKGRPESLNRYPNGIYGKNFYQKDVEDAPQWIDTKQIYSASNKKNIKYLLCNNKASLLYLVNLGCIEINPWFSRTDKLDFPSYSVLDLDPENIGFDKVIETALTIKEILDEISVKSFCKTSGASGLHIYIPLKNKYPYEISKEFAYLIGKLTVNRLPTFTSLERNPAKRRRRVYLDYLQNRSGQTLVAPYSVRPRQGATVSTPLEWKEVKLGLDPKQFTIKNIVKRIKEKGDIFKPILGRGINIEKCIRQLESKYR